MSKQPDVELVSAGRSYPHARDDCDSCRERDADMLAIYPELGPGRDVRWCHRCAGQVLTRLVQEGIIVTVCSLAGCTSPTWTVDLADEVLSRAKPIGLGFLRSLIDEGGTATAARLRELLAVQQLQHATLTLNQAARNTLHPTERRTMLTKGRFLVAPHTHPDHRGRVYEYVLPEDLVPIFDTALRKRSHAEGTQLPPSPST